MNNRRSLIIKAGRHFQEMYRYFGFFDYFFKVFFSVGSENRITPTVILLAPPRSGSTLAYQLLTSGIKNFHLTNIWNLFYATPFLGGLISRKLCENYVSGFHSNSGFVPGLRGEAEGLKFWSYWSGQTLEENPGNFNYEKMMELSKTIQQLGNKETGAFITGYLGHVFCVEELRKVFPKIIFIHLTRNWLSNAYSLYKYSGNKWVSTKPKEYKNHLELTNHERVVIQLQLIHKKILAQSKNEDIIQINYRDMCNNPHNTLKNIIEFAHSKNIELSSKHLDNVPTSFKESITNKDQDEDSFKIYNYINKRIELVSEEDRAFFRRLL